MLTSEMSSPLWASPGYAPTWFIVSFLVGMKNENDVTVTENFSPVSATEYD